MDVSLCTKVISRETKKTSSYLQSFPISFTQIVEVSNFDLSVPASCKYLSTLARTFFVCSVISPPVPSTWPERYTIPLCTTAWLIGGRTSTPRRTILLLKQAVCTILGVDNDAFWTTFFIIGLKLRSMMMRDVSSCYLGGQVDDRLVIN